MRVSGTWQNNGWLNNVSLTEKSYYTGIILNSIKNIRESVADDANYRERSEPTRTLANR